MLKPLQLATIMWAHNPKNRQTLKEVLSNPSHPERSFVRAALALAWHHDEAARNALPKLFTLERKSPNAVPKLILTKVLSELDDVRSVENDFRGSIRALRSLVVYSPKWQNQTIGFIHGKAHHRGVDSNTVACQSVDSPR